MILIVHMIHITHIIHMINIILMIHMILMIHITYCPLYIRSPICLAVTGPVAIDASIL